MFTQTIIHSSQLRAIDLRSRCEDSKILMRVDTVDGGAIIINFPVQPIWKLNAAYCAEVNRTGDCTVDARYGLNSTSTSSIPPHYAYGRSYQPGSLTLRRLQIDDDTAQV